MAVRFRPLKPGEQSFEVLKLTSVRGGHVDLDQSKHGAWSEAEARPFAVRDGDFLIVRGNGSRKLVGRGGVVGKVTKAVAYPDTLVRARFDDELVHLPFFAAIWDSATIREQIERAAKTTAGIYKINQKDLGELVIPIPDLDSQKGLFTSWSANESILSRIELCASQISTRIAHLRQAILAKAFSGQLVPQGPNDEPASTLLERIRRERKDPVAGKPSRKRNRPQLVTA